MARVPKLPLFVPRTYTKLGKTSLMDRILFRVNATICHYEPGCQPFRLIDIKEISKDYFEMTFGVQTDDPESIRVDLIKWFERCIITGLPFSEMFFDFVCRGWTESTVLNYVKYNDMYNALRHMYHPREFDLPKNVAPGDEWEYIKPFYTKDELYNYSLVGYNADNKAVTYPLTHQNEIILNGVEFVYRLRFQHRTALCIQTVDTTEVEL